MFFAFLKIFFLFKFLIFYVGRVDNKILTYSVETIDISKININVVNCFNNTTIKSFNDNDVRVSDV